MVNCQKVSKCGLAPKVNITSHTKHQITNCCIPQKSTRLLFLSKYISCFEHRFLSSTKPNEPCTTLSSNVELVLTFFLIMAMGIWIWLVIVIPLSAQLFTLREVYQLTKKGTAYNALFKFCLCLHLTISASLSSWIILSCFQLGIKEVIHVASKEKVHSPQVSISQLSIYQQS